MHFTPFARSISQLFKNIKLLFTKITEHGMISEKARSSAMLETILASGLEQLNIPFDDAQLEQFRLYYTLCH